MRRRSRFRAVIIALPAVELLGPPGTRSLDLRASAADRRGVSARPDRRVGGSARGYQGVGGSLSSPDTAY
jgi:hypothetical protein